MPTLETTATDVPTQVGTILPRTSDRERRRATRTSPRLDPGRYLAIDDGDDVVVIALGGGTLHLGRSVAADIMLEHLSVSRRHAIVASRDGETVILDDRSLNGVLVNGERVREARLRHGDAIQLGEVTLRYLQMT
jgi:pSer/pThr/pTyr-binding forkhead associated (FHA) protein